MMDNCYYQLLSPISYIIIFIFLYIILFYILGISVGSDPFLWEPSIKYLSRYLNIWTLSHFFFFAWIGYHYPDCLEAAMVYGIAWETFEFSLGEFFPKFFPKIANRIDPTWTLWYYGRYEDIIMNFLGFVVGKYFKKFRESSILLNRLR